LYGLHSDIQWFWKTKQNISETMWNNIDWVVLVCAYTESTTAQQPWVAKYTSRYFGHGKIWCAGNSNLQQPALDIRLPNKTKNILPLVQTQKPERLGIRHSRILKSGSGRIIWTWWPSLRLYLRASNNGMKTQQAYQSTHKCPLVQEQNQIRWNYVYDSWLIRGWQEQQEASWAQMHWPMVDGQTH